jgi:hypothetical protein
MTPDRSRGAQVDTVSGGWNLLAAPGAPRKGLRGQDLSTSFLPALCKAAREPSIGVPIWRAVRLPTAGTPILGHDVSGIGSQIAGLAMQSITTMVPVWQCGHSRNDCPVRASKRSR